MSEVLQQWLVILCIHFVDWDDIRECLRCHMPKWVSALWMMDVAQSCHKIWSIIDPLICVCSINSNTVQHLSSSMHFPLIISIVSLQSCQGELLFWRTYTIALYKASISKWGQQHNSVCAWYAYTLLSIYCHLMVQAYHMPSSTYSAFSALPHFWAKKIAVTCGVIHVLNTLASDILLCLVHFSWYYNFGSFPALQLLRWVSIKHEVVFTYNSFEGLNLWKKDVPKQCLKVILYLHTRCLQNKRVNKYIMLSGCFS